MNYLLLAGLLTLVFAFNVSFAYSEELILSAESTSSTYNVGVYPSITGQITGSQGEPISNVYVYAMFPSKTAEAMTGNNGKFLLNPMENYPVGEYSIDVYARSGTVLSRTTVTFEIVEPSNQEKSEWLSENINLKTNSTLPAFRGYSSNSTLQLELSTYQMVSQNQQNQTKNVTNSETLDFIEQQRNLAQWNLEADLAENSRDIQQSENRDSFASFVSKLDSIVHAIFWDQFEFTQKKSEDAYQAKLGALEDGKTSQEAMKAYHEKAATSRTEIAEYMKNLNIKHGFTNSSLQESFDEFGKAPRNGGN